MRHLLGSSRVTSQVQDFRPVKRGVALVTRVLRGSGQSIDLFGQRESRPDVTLAGQQPGSHAQAIQLRRQVVPAPELQTTRRPLLELLAPFATLQSQLRPDGQSANPYIYASSHLG